MLKNEKKMMSLLTPINRRFMHEAWKLEMDCLDVSDEDGSLYTVKFGYVDAAPGMYIGVWYVNGNFAGGSWLASCLIPNGCALQSVLPPTVLGKCMAHAARIEKLKAFL